ncbi:hypothetical protein, partial [Burkholderia cenocepacia]
ACRGFVWFIVNWRGGTSAIGHFDTLDAADQTVDNHLSRTRTDRHERNRIVETYACFAAALRFGARGRMVA